MNQNSPMKLLQLDGAVVDLQRGVARVDGAESQLTDKELALLVYLYQQRGKAVSREELLVEVWDYHPSSRSRTVDTTMRRLRKRVDPSARDLVTVYGEGYRLNLPSAPTVAPVPVRTPPALKGNVELIGPPGSGRRAAARTRSHDLWVEICGDPTPQAALRRWSEVVGSPLATADQLRRWLNDESDLCICIAGLEAGYPLFDAVAEIIALGHRWTLITSSPLGIGAPTSFPASTTVPYSGPGTWGALPRSLPTSALSEVVGPVVLGELRQRGAITDDAGRSTLDAVMHELARRHPEAAGPQRLLAWWLRRQPHLGVSALRALLDAVPWVSRYADARSMAELVGRCRHALTGMDIPGPIDDSAEVRLWRSDGALRLGDLDAAMDWVRDLPQPAAVLRRASIDLIRGDAAAAAPVLEGLTGLSAADDAVRLERLARIARSRSDWVAAEEAYYGSIERAERAGDDARVCLAWTGLGNTHLFRGQLCQSRDAYERARKHSHEDHSGRCITDSNYAMVLAELGEAEAAAKIAAASAGVARVLGLEMAEAVSTRALTHALAWGRQMPAARHAYGRALTLSRAHERPIQVRYTRLLGTWVGLLVDGPELVPQVRALLEEAEHPMVAGFATLHLALCLHWRGQLDEAAPLYLAGIDALDALDAGHHLPRWIGLASLVPDLQARLPDAVPGGEQPADVAYLVRLASTDPGHESDAGLPNTLPAHVGLKLASTWR